MPALPFDVDDAADDDGKYLGRTVPLYPPALAGKELGRDSAWALDGVTLPQPSHHPLDLPVAAVVAQDGGDEGGTTAAGSIAIYYGAKGVQEGDTLLNVLAQPGAMLIVALSQGNDAKRVIGLLGDLATPIQIGSMDAVLTHSSAYANGVRAFELYWSDGRFDFSLLVNGSAREAIETAQSMYCG